MPSMIVLTGRMRMGPETSQDLDGKVLGDHQVLSVDAGCDLAPACLSCPLPSCRYDLPQGANTARHQLRMLHRVAEIKTQGLSAEDAAERYGVSARTVYRWLRHAKRSGPEVS